MGSVLTTDKYKMTMAEVAPLREETFVFSFRRGGDEGWHYNPIDFHSFIRKLLPTATASDHDALSTQFIHLSSGVRLALSMTSKLKIRAIPKGSWFLSGEPIVTITGPSALVSWIEPLLIQAHWLIQCATRIKVGRFKDFQFSSLHEADWFEEHLDDIYPIDGIPTNSRFLGEIEAKARAIVDLVGPERAFEVGLRSASCPLGHMDIVRACRLGGITQTSNVSAAFAYGLSAVGTMGHEHVMRHGNDDYAAFKAMRDRTPGLVSYLLDTNGTVSHGIPAAIRVMKEYGDAGTAIRFDTDINNGLRAQYLYAVEMLRQNNLEPTIIIESGWDLDKTMELEELRKLVRWPVNKQTYGYGGYLSNSPTCNSPNRDDVAAVYKLSMSGGRPTRKFGDGTSKRSLSGVPLAYRAPMSAADYNGGVSIILQEGEEWAPGRLSFRDLIPVTASVGTHYRLDRDENLPVNRKNLILSPETQALMDQCVIRNHKES